MGSLVEVREHRGLDARDVAFDVAERQNVVLDNRRTQEIAELAGCVRECRLCAQKATSRDAANEQGISSPLGPNSASRAKGGLSDAWGSDEGAVARRS